MTILQKASTIKSDYWEGGVGGNRPVSVSRLIVLIINLQLAPMIWKHWKQRQKSSNHLIFSLDWDLQDIPFISKMTTTDDMMEGLKKVIIKYTFILILPFSTEILTHVEFIPNLRKKKKKSETTKTRLLIESISIKIVFVKSKNK